MIRTAKVLSMIILGLLALSGVAQAASTANAGAQNDFYHLCTDGDLVGGTWKLVVLRETPKRKEAAMYQHIRFQYLSFFTQNIYSFINTNREMSSLDVRRLMWGVVSGRAPLKYTLDDKGVLDLFIGKRMTYSYRCLAVTRNKDNYYKKGDLILSGYTRRGRTQLFKLYRRWF